MDLITLQFRKTHAEDIRHLVTYRIDFLKELKKITPEASLADIEHFKSNLWAYFEKSLSSDAFAGFIAELNNEIVSVAGMVINEYPPFIDQQRRLQGYIFNVYTVPAYRKKSISTTLLKYLINEAKKMGITQLYLHSTEIGENVYKRLGFQEPESKAMQLKLL